MTPAATRALTLLQQKGPMTARAFAHAMWPDAPGHTKPSKCSNNGITRGGGMVMAAGSFLARLMRTGYVGKDYTRREYSLLKAGADALKKETHDDHAH